jgi:hypothetical protein
MAAPDRETWVLNAKSGALGVQRRALIRGSAGSSACPAGMNRWPAALDRWPAVSGRWPSGSIRCPAGPIAGFSESNRWPAEPHAWPAAPDGGFAVPIVSSGPPNSPAFAPTTGQPRLIDPVGPAFPAPSGRIAALDRCRAEMIIGEPASDGCRDLELSASYTPYMSVEMAVLDTALEILVRKCRNPPKSPRHRDRGRRAENSRASENRESRGQRDPS